MRGRENSQFHGYDPIHLIGYSFGGYLAIELARQLIGHGKPVPVVGIIDTLPPRASFAMTERIFHFARNFGPWVLAIATRLARAEQLMNLGESISRKLRRQHKVRFEDWYKRLPLDRKNITDQNLANSRKFGFEGRLPRHDFPISATTIGATV